MSRIKSNKSKRLGKAAIAIFAVAIICVVGITFRYFSKGSGLSNEKEALLESLKIEFHDAGSVSSENIIKFEYANEKLNFADLIKKSNGDISFEGEKMIDLSVIGDKVFNITLSSKLSNSETVSKKFKYTVRVADTKPAIITLRQDKLEVTAGEAFDPKENIESVKDPVDGDLSFSEGQKDGSYFVEADVNTENAGEYSVTVKATDKNGNKSESKYTVTVLSAEAPVSINTSVSSDYDMPYLIRVNRAANRVNIYSKDAGGSYNEPVISFICSTGLDGATPLGDYTVTSNKWEWLALIHGVYGQYVTQFYGDYLFHSVPYLSVDNSDLNPEEFVKLGTFASAGCVRLCVRDAKWIYDNCGAGTSVIIYDDAANPSPISPRGLPDMNTYAQSPNKGWDPTDPDPGNPW